jgi:hypothetical protein
VTFVSKDILVKSLGDGKNWRLHEDVVYKDGDEEYRVPGHPVDGYVTDFASVPRATSWLYPPFADYAPAAIIHDWLITDLLPTGQIDSTTVDRTFREAMKELGVIFPRRWIMWAGVRLGAIGNPRRRAGSLKTFPLMLLVMLLASPMVLIPSLVVQVWLWLVWLGSQAFPKHVRPDAQKT